MAASCPNEARTSPPPGSATVAGGRSRSPRYGMTVNAAHHSPALSRLSRTVASVDSPIASCAVTTPRLTASSSPPPA